MPAFRGQQARVRLAEQFLLRVAEVAEHRLVADCQASLRIEAEVHDWGLLVKIAQRLLVQLQLLIRLREPLIRLGEFLGSAAQLAFGQDAVCHVEEMATEV